MDNQITKSFVDGNGLMIQAFSPTGQGAECADHPNVAILENTWQQSTPSIFLRYLFNQFSSGISLINLALIDSFNQFSNFFSHFSNFFNGNFLYQWSQAGLSLPCLARKYPGGHLYSQIVWEKQNRGEQHAIQGNSDENRGYCGYFVFVRMAYGVSAAC
ncbi:hypothetical protein HYU14_04610 [Candidatus Woesearchaeota archaeon]|nr:hypothetical protein [Candidatus Woesearchaeota archaeon]